MNVITNSLLIFIFIFTSLIIGIPGLDNDNIFKNKIYLFAGLFIFQLLLKSIYKLKYKCSNIDIKIIINESIMMGIYSVIGYSLYIDLLNMASTRNYIIPHLDNKHSQVFIISSIISVFIMICLISSIIITGYKDECIN
jgi:hypothetical protein